MSTVKLERWRGHVVAARRQGIPLSHYAREHGISRYTLYAAQRQLRSEGCEATKRAARPGAMRADTSPFVAVRVAEAEATPAALRARLPNGVELAFGPLDSDACATLVRMLAALPCSG